MNAENIKHLVELNKDYLIATRRYLHANPELSFSEIKTSEFILSELKKYGIPGQIYAKTGILAQIGKGEKVIALRADMDALPIHEKTDIEYKSLNVGVMHACGHDAHTAMLLGVISILNQIKTELKGVVKFIFQPAEEKLPGGALQMINEGVLQSPEVQNVIGQHVYPDLETGKAGFCTGNYMASTDEIYITIKGKGGHAAIPWDLIDPVSIAAQLITSLQQVISRKTPATIPSVLSFGKIIANGATNVIPETVFIEGTFRTFNEKFRAEAHKIISEMTISLVEGMGGNVLIDIKKGYPVLFNDPALTERLKFYASDYLGNKNVVELSLRMTSEDFSYFSQHKPSSFFRLGTASPGMENYPLHNARFNIDENSLVIGTGLMAWIAINELQNEK